MSVEFGFKITEFFLKRNARGLNLSRLFFLPSQTKSLSFVSPPAPPQVVYFTEMYTIFSDLTDQIDQAGLTDEQRERETEAKLGELRALSIVADD